MAVALQACENRFLILQFNVQGVNKNDSVRLARIDTAARNRKTDQLVGSDIQPFKNGSFDFSFGVV